MKDGLKEEVAAFIERWNAAIASKDSAAAAALRDERYCATLPGDRELSREQELAMIASIDLRVGEAKVERIEIRGGGRRARVRMTSRIDFNYQGEALEGVWRCELELARSHGEWRALRSRVADGDGAVHHERRNAVSRALPKRLRRWLGRARRALRPPEPAAWVRYRGGADFVFRPGDVAAAAEGEDLPIPPKELWLGYYYPAHGAAQVRAMLDLVAASGMAFSPGDRILDFGCGAGRLIRHLRDLASSCEIWGADISAEHIYWCRHHLSPPFHFLTSTRLPHLPFADASFRLIYAGSVFTHIDDLADAWLLELGRLLRPDGRLYLTVHDERTVELFDDWRHASSDIVRAIKSQPLFAAAGEPFAMLALGRDADPQVFYARDYFARMAASAGFDIVSVAPEAYFYQTAFVLKPKPRPDQAQ